MNIDTIIESYQLNKLLLAELNGRKLCKFLPKITMDPWDQRALRTWKLHLTAKRCPWAITLTAGKNILWKIDETATAKEKAAIRDDPKQSWFQDGPETRAPYVKNIKGRKRNGAIIQTRR